jgi:predicted alpha/beta superfamily hydrolase
MKTILTLFIIIVISINLTLSGQILSQTIEIGEKLTISSKILDEDRQILIRLPKNYNYSDTKYPVLYVLDGEFFFHQANSAVNFLSECSYIYNNIIPEMIVVALVNVDRNRDYTLTYAPNQLGILYYPTSGKADRFLEFLEKELIPEIDNNYRTQPFRTLAGWSFGGLLTIHTFARKPGLFTAYLAISPSLWWDEDMYVSKFDSIFENYQFLPKKLTITCGTLEGGNIGRSVRDGFVPIMKNMIPDDYQFNFVEIPDEGHSFVPYKAFYDGLVSVFSDYPMPLEKVNEGYESITKYFSELSEKYGYEIKVSEWAYMSLINDLNGKDKHTEAMEIARQYQSDYPHSPWAILLIGSTFEHMGNYDKAKENFELAIKIEKSKPEPDSERIISFTLELNLLNDKINKDE